MSDEQLAKPIPSFHELFERSKNDRAMIVGSEVREVIARVRELEQALQELAGAVFGTIPDSEPDVYADYDRLCELEEHCNAALRGTDKVAKNG